MYPPPQTAGRLLLLALAAACSEPEPDQRPGLLTVEVSTLGEDPDLDGYRLRVDATTYDQVLISSNHAFDNLAPGPHDVELQGLSANCTVTGGARRQVHITSVQETRLAFEVTCFAVGIEVFAAQVGLDIDNDLTAVIDGTPTPLSSYTSARVTRLLPGVHTVSLIGIDSNCTLTGPGTHQVQVTNLQVTPVSFELTCVTTKAVVVVTATTSGLDSDLNGYLVRFNGNREAHLSANLDILAMLIPGGDATVELDDVAQHCAVQGSRTRTIHTVTGKVLERDTARVSFQLSCGQLWTFALVRNGAVTLITADGSAAHRVRNGLWPAWSPDGRHLSYECDGRLCVDRMDGARVVAPDRQDEYESSPAWRPDGRLSFVGYACDWYCYAYTLSGIHSVGLNGSGMETLSIPSFVRWVSDLSWSPSGDRLALTCDLDERREICTMNVAGGLEILTNSVLPNSGELGASWGPAWSPDGQRLAFATTKYGQFPEIVIREPNGTIRRVNPEVFGEEPFWSPDGLRLVFAGAGTTERGLYIMNIDGTGLVRVTNGQDYGPVWRPLGQME